MACAPYRLNEYLPSVRSAGQRYNGLKNQGATCYLNTLLQCFYMTKEFRKKVESFERDPQKSDKESADLVHELQKLFKELKKVDGTTEGITQCLCISNVHEQQDAVEYYKKILKIIGPEVSQIFEGKMSSKTKCQYNHTFQENCPFFTIPLSIDTEPHVVFNVMEGLKSFFKKVKLHEDNLVYCDCCEQKAEAETWTEIEEFPLILTLYLKRFYFDYNQMRLVKNNCGCDIPLHLQISNCKYELYAVINHIGGRNGGHYNAVIKSFEDDEWYCFDDSSVMKENDPELSFHNSSLAYLLMYRKQVDELHSDVKSTKLTTHAYVGKLEVPPGYHPTDVENERGQLCEAMPYREQLYRNNLLQMLMNLAVQVEQLNQSETLQQMWTEIEEFPLILTLYLKRFYFDYNQMRLVKNNCVCDIPLHLQISNCKYELYAVINHIGGRNGRHYNAVIKSFEDDEWYCFDDSSVMKENDPELSFHNLPQMRMNLAVEEEQLNQAETLQQMVEVPKELKNSYVYTEEREQTKLSDTQIDKSHKRLTGNQKAFLNVRTSDMFPEKGKHVEHYWSEKMMKEAITKEDLVGLEVHDKVLSPERVTVEAKDSLKHLRKYHECASCVVGVYVEATKERQAWVKNMITQGTALQRLEVQAASGYVIDPICNQNLTVNEAVTMKVVGPQFKQKLLYAEGAVIRYTDQCSGKVISLFQAIKENRILKDHGIRLLKAQIATGGIIDPKDNRHLPVAVAYKHELFDDEINRMLTDPASDTKGFFEENLTYPQLLERCITDPETGLTFLLLKKKKQGKKTSLSV